MSVETSPGSPVAGHERPGSFGSLASEVKRSHGSFVSFQHGSFGSLPPELYSEDHTVPGVINSIGMGCGQWTMFFVSGFALLLVDGIIHNLSTLTIPSQSVELHVEYNQRGLLQTVFILGYCCGSFMSAAVADTIGRRNPIVLAFFIIAVFSYAMTLALDTSEWVSDASTTSPMFAYILLCRFFPGFGLGFGSPVARAYTSEITPEYQRLMVASVMKGGMLIGGMSAKLLVWIDDPHFYDISWRTLWVIGGGISALLFLVSSLVLIESPMYLASVGRHEEALQILDCFKSSSYAQEIIIDYDVQKASAPQGQALGFGERVQSIFSRHSKITAVTLMCVAFFNGMGNGGFNYLNPLVLSELTAVPGAQQLEIIAIFNILAAWLCWFLTFSHPRKTVLTVALLAVSIFCMIQRVASYRSDFDSVMYNVAIQVGMIGNNMALTVCEIITLQMAADVFPPYAAGTGMALVYGCDRLGALVAPQIFESIMKCTGHYQVYFTFYSMITFFGFIVMLFTSSSLAAYDTRKDEEYQALQPLEPATPRSYGAAGAMLDAAR